MRAGAVRGATLRKTGADACAQAPKITAMLDTRVYTHQLVAKHHLTKNQQKLTEIGEQARRQAR